MRSLRLELPDMPKLATKNSRQIVELQVMIYMVKKVLYIFTSLAIWCVGGEEWGNGVGRVLGMVVGSLHRIIGCVGELSLLVIFPCFVVQNNRGVDNLAKPKPEPTLPPKIGVANEST